MHILLITVLLTMERVSMGSAEHWIPVLIALVLGSGLVVYAKQKLNKKNQELLIHIFAIGISLTVITFHLHKFIFETYDVRKDLPLYLCSLLGILIPIFTWCRKYWMYEILVFWIIAGTLQGIITPDIATGFPTFDYLRYWAVHLGLFIIIIYATFVFEMRPNFKSVFKSFFALQVYVLGMVVINFILDANYFYLNQKPKSASLLDYFGEWPLYIIVVQLILIPYFLIIYLPFYVVQKRTALKG
ncbi:putative integral membrane protein (TIGR02206 family) [Gelidibacter algens]|uniref:Putative integral membrane protein (TIGR02206 family) n=1 Tax=Gelidibacter algens TaxID=49280 RepID=A0A327RWE0_9FLAO|nr:TIGR02206 family membrane protein [Gelidibacter algens]RAJ20775.1 putative integral membrane protein (TIGR02206 family) [Gelidibacter algens]